MDLELLLIITRASQLASRNFSMPFRFLIPLAILAAAAVLWSPWSRVRAARSRAELAHQRLEAALQSERDLAALRRHAPGLQDTHTPPHDDLAILVQLAAREAGLSAQAIAEVAPQESITLPGAEGASPGSTASPGALRWKRHAVFVRLAALPLPDVGAFLHQLRASAPAWTVAQVDLRAEPARAGGPSHPTSAGSTSTSTTNPETVLYALSLRLTRTHLDAPTTTLPPSPARDRP
ncbi:MAG: hypothetical protein JNK35_10905 [Phycisphaerae bacterium]|nr:hypothetical protein [Phycisphaerae bacterium]